MSVVVQCATPEEFGALVAAFAAGQSKRSGRREYAAAEDSSWILLRASVGKARAASGAELAVTSFKPSLIVDFGAAGALTPELVVGDMIVARSVIDGAELFDVDLSRASRVLDGRSIERLEAKQGRLAVVSDPVETQAARRQLASTTGALAVCWETAAIARICKRHDVAFFSLRVVSDIGNGSLQEEYRSQVSKALAPAAEALCRLIKGR